MIAPLPYCSTADRQPARQTVEPRNRCLVLHQGLEAKGLPRQFRLSSAMRATSMDRRATGLRTPHS